MRRRMIGLSGLLTASLLATAVGCESFRHATRTDKDDPATALKADALEPTAVDGDATKIHAVDGDGKSGGAQPFFKNSRKPGALSSEGRDIEKSLGVH